MSTHAPRNAADARGLHFFVAAAQFNATWTDALLERCRAVLAENGAGRVEQVRVPGSFELPFVCAQAARSGRYDAIVALGILLKGETNHHDVVGRAVTDALLRINVDLGVPVINGVVTVDTPRQAEERCGPPHDRGAEFARAAIAMARLHKGLDVPAVPHS